MREVYKASIKSGIEYSEEQINSDFSVGGLIARSYWNSFLDNFNPDMVLKESEWEMGLVKKHKAEIRIRHKKSTTPAILKMFKEDGAWKTGLVETFWTRKSIK